MRAEIIATGLSRPADTGALKVVLTRDGDE
jgi:hypothetical protein